jgi:hypothetical protein
MTAIRRCFILLLSVVLLMSVGVMSLHLVGHQYGHLAIHTVENELQACHRAIFHGDVSGCEHKSHVHSRDANCRLCDLINQRHDQAVFPDQLQKSNDHILGFREEILRSLVKCACINQGQRGPPKV